jgi:hypothetical protein
MDLGEGQAFTPKIHWYLREHKPTDFARRANQRGLFATCESSPFRKNISVFPKPKSVLYHGHPVPREGRWPSSRTLGRDAVDADGATDEST